MPIAVKNQVSVSWNHRIRQNQNDTVLILFGKFPEKRSDLVHENRNSSANRFPMKPEFRLLLFRFGLLVLLVLVALQVSRHALLLQPRSAGMLIGLGAVVLLGSGYLLARWLQPVPPRPDAGELPPLADPKAFGISPREYEVLQAMARGASNRQIAQQLFIAESTVKTHVSNLLAKLDVQSRTQAVVRARAWGLVD